MTEFLYIGLIILVLLSIDLIDLLNFEKLTKIGLPMPVFIYAYLSTVHFNLQYTFMVVLSITLMVVFYESKKHLTSINEKIYDGAKIYIKDKALINRAKSERKAPYLAVFLTAVFALINLIIALITGFGVWISNNNIVLLAFLIIGFTSFLSFIVSAILKFPRIFNEVKKKYAEFKRKKKR